VKPFELLAHSSTADGTVLKLVRRDTEYLILADDKPLMSSRMHGSEEALALAACRKARTLKQPHVLIGGLGMGFTLRAALQILPPQAKILVAELVPAVVEWNRGPLGELAQHPLNDPRVGVKIDDVAATLRYQPNQFDAILLDVDNGPAAFTVSNNAGLYDNVGLAAAFRALKHNGVLAVWSARADKKFEQRLGQAGFTVEVERAQARGKTSGTRHTIYLAHKSPSTKNR
jgi:spermidine synthase